MELHYTWKTKIFSNNQKIFKLDRQVGGTNEKPFSRSASGELNGRGFLFEIKGFLKQEIRIINSADETPVAEIKLGPWRTKATIHYNLKEYIWQHENFWNTRWSIGTDNGALVKYHSAGMKGEITSYSDDEVLILAGLFIKNYFRQRAAAIAATT